MWAYGLVRIERTFLTKLFLWEIGFSIKKISVFEELYSGKNSFTVKEF